MPFHNKSIGLNTGTNPLTKSVFVENYSAGNSGIPANAMLFEDGTPMLYEDGTFMIYEE